MTYYLNYFLVVKCSKFAVVLKYVYIIVNNIAAIVYLISETMYYVCVYMELCCFCLNMFLPDGERSFKTGYFRINDVQFVRAITFFATTQLSVESMTVVSVSYMEKKIVRRETFHTHTFTRLLPSWKIAKLV